MGTEAELAPQPDNWSLERVPGGVRLRRGGAGPQLLHWIVFGVAVMFMSGLYLALRTQLQRGGSPWPFLFAIPHVLVGLGVVWYVVRRVANVTVVEATRVGGFVVAEGPVPPRRRLALPPGDLVQLTLIRVQHGGGRPRYDLLATTRDDRRVPVLVGRPSEELRYLAALW